MPTTPVQNLFSLRGKVALLTGATGHLGAAMADALAEAGAQVIASSRTLASAQSVAARLPQLDRPHLAITLDHTDESSIERGFTDALRQAGRVDILINNGHDPLAADWTTVTADQFTRHMANATGYFLLARHLHAHSLTRPGGASVIMVGSMYGSVASYPDAYANLSTASPVAYHALKGGILQMTRHLAVYWAKDNVRVNSLSPGPFPSPKAPPAMVERLTAKSPLGRMGRPDELKGPLLFLASDASSYMTGQNLIIDGGWTAW